MPHTTRVTVLMPDGKETRSSVNTCNRLESEQAGQWLGPRYFQVFKRNPDNDGTTGTWKGRHSDDTEREFKGLRYPQHKVMQLDRGITSR